MSIIRVSGVLRSLLNNVRAGTTKTDNYYSFYHKSVRVIEEISIHRPTYVPIVDITYTERLAQFNVKYCD